MKTIIKINKLERHYRELLNGTISTQDRLQNYKATAELYGSYVAEKISELANNFPRDENEYNLVLLTDKELNELEKKTIK